MCMIFDQRLFPNRDHTQTNTQWIQFRQYIQYIQTTSHSIQMYKHEDILVGIALMRALLAPHSRHMHKPLRTPLKVRTIFLAGTRQNRTKFLMHRHRHGSWMYSKNPFAFSHCRHIGWLVRETGNWKTQRERERRARAKQRSHARESQSRRMCGCFVT